MQSGNSQQGTTSGINNSVNDTLADDFPGRVNRHDLGVDVLPPPVRNPAQKINPQDLATLNQAAVQLDNVSAAENFSNLLETPVLFILRDRIGHQQLRHHGMDLRRFKGLAQPDSCHQ